VHYVDVGYYVDVYRFCVVKYRDISSVSLSSCAAKYAKSMCMCMYVYVHIRMCVCVNVCACESVRVCVRDYVPNTKLRTRAHTCTHTRIHANMHIYPRLPAEGSCQDIIG